VSSGGVNIIFSDSNTHFRGAENYRRSGEADAMRIPKDGYFAHQVMWDGWVDVERPRIHIIGHWNYEPDTKKDVYVVSSADQVELFLNGQSLGFGIQSSRFLYTFKDVEWQAGTLKAVGSDIAGKKICETETKTAGKPDSIRLSVFTGPVGLRADGQRSTAWVEYQFDHPVPISEVTLKLGDWRQRSYPLRISVDGQEAFTGTTPRSLGYVTLPLKPTTGKSLKVELTGQAGGQDAFNITELAAQKDDKAVGSGQGGGKGTLNIIEIEIYGPAASGPKPGITLR
jgi:hypothetical protein